MKFIAYDLANLEIWKIISNYFTLTFRVLKKIYHWMNSVEFGNSIY